MFTIGLMLLLFTFLGMSAHAHQKIEQGKLEPPVLFPVVEPITDHILSHLAANTYVSRL